MSYITNFTRSLYVATQHVTIGNSDVETTMLSSSCMGTLVLPALFFEPGRLLHFVIRGFLSAGSGQESYFRIKLNGTDVIEHLGTLPNGLTNAYVEAVFDMLCHTIGDTGTIHGTGRTLISTATGIVNSAMRPLMMMTDFTLNTNITQTFDCTYQWVTAAAGNTVTLTHAYIIADPSAFVRCWT